MNGFSLFQKDHLGSQCEFQFSLIDKNKLLSRMLVLHHLMLLFGFNGDHERPEVFIRSPGGQGSVRIVLSALREAFLPLPVYLNLFLIGQKVTGVNVKGIGQLQQKGNRRRQAVRFDLLDELRRLASPFRQICHAHFSVFP